MRGAHWISLLAIAALGCETRSSANAEPSPSTPSAPSAEPAKWWVSAEECQRSLEARPPRQPSGRARIGSWNIRWFPDGREGTQRLEHGTDIAWLACGIAQIEADVLGVQEFKIYPGAVQAIDKLIATLDRLTLGRWKLETEKCGKPEWGHVGLLWDSSRVTVRAIQEYAEPLVGNRCNLDWRPAMAGHFTFPGGFDTHVIVLHNVAGEERARFEGRARAFDAIDTLRDAVVKKHFDQDVVILGDLNTTGCAYDCNPERTSRHETDLLRTRLAKTSPSLDVVPSTLACSEYHDQAPYLLDHVIVSSATRELAKGARAAIDGYCTESKCSDDYEPEERDYYTQLSDHCPLLLDFVDRDLD
jgi:endonuclease/exonuclease/phosphatase family metal-dependent hydrolase